MMNKKELDRIKKEVALEFPEDDALQQVHIARKLIAEKAKTLGLTYLQYVVLAFKAAKAGPQGRAAQPSMVAEKKASYGKR